MAEKKRKKRRCKSCGAVMPPCNIYLCDACQEAGMGRKNDKGLFEARELLLIAKCRQEIGVCPIAQMDMAQVNTLARCFMPPYSTYGRFRGYVEETGRLPPMEFLREDMRS